jgi:hypothetical protein
LKELIMRPTVFSLLTMCLLACGCNNFSGEWLELPREKTPDDALTEDDTYRVALQFDPVSTVRSGFFSERMGVVDDKSVQADTYFLFDGWQRAQFGTVIATMHGDRLTAQIGNRPPREFARVYGKSIFPPLVRWPQYSAEAKPAAGSPKYASAAP